MIDVLEGYTTFPSESFNKHVETFYPLAVALLEKELGEGLRASIWAFFRKVGETKFNMAEYVRPRADSIVSATPTSPGPRHGFARRDSRLGERRISRGPVES